MEDAVTWGCRALSSVPHHDTWLTGVEQREQERFTMPRRRADWRLGRWTAKHVIVAWLARQGRPARPGDVAIVARAHDDGFPMVTVPTGPAPSISISHRDGAAVCIAGPPDTAVGCDLERIEPRPSSFVADWFTPQERRLVRSTPDEHRSEVVTLIWSAKESALKALGVGLRLDTREVEVDLGDHHRHGPAAEWQRVSVASAKGHSFSGWWGRTGPQVLVLVAGRDLLSATPPDAGPTSPSGAWPPG